MATFGAMKTAIARRLLDDSNTAVTLVEIGTAINDAISFWKQRRFWFNSTSQVLAITAADTTITLPSDFLIEIPRNAITVTQNSVAYPVTKISPVMFDSILNTSSTGRPKYYCYRDGALQIAPYADIDYEGMIYYIKDYTAFVTDTSEDALSNDFTTIGDRLIQATALAHLHGELRQDEKMESRYATRAQLEYNQLLGRTNQALKTGTLSIEQ